MFFVSSTRLLGSWVGDFVLAQGQVGKIQVQWESNLVRDLHNEP